MCKSYEEHIGVHKTKRFNVSNSDLNLDFVSSIVPQKETKDAMMSALEEYFALMVTYNSVKAKENFVKVVARLLELVLAKKWKNFQFSTQYNLKNGKRFKASIKISQSGVICFKVLTKGSFIVKDNDVYGENKKQSKLQKALNNEIKKLALK